MAEIQKVTDPLKVVTDELVLKSLAEQGIDKDYVEFYQDYALPDIIDGKVLKGKSPYAKFYRDLKSNKGFMVTSALPKVNQAGKKIVTKWVYSDDKYYSGENLFSAVIDKEQISVTSNGKSVTWTPQLYLDNVLQTGSSTTLLDVDPSNENYLQNTLEWNYGNVKRRVRLIQGRLREKWLTTHRGLHRIDHNPVGDIKLILGYGSRADRVPIEIKVSGSSEIVDTSDFPDSAFPVEIGASPETYNPQADDGNIFVKNATKATARDATTGTVTTAGTLYTGSNLDWNASDGYAYYRYFATFNTAALPDVCTITGAVYSIYGDTYQTENNAGFADNCLFEGTQQDTLVADDYDAFNTTLLTSSNPSWTYPISQAAYNDASLNASGLALINKTGLTKYCIRVNGQVIDGTPTAQNYDYFWAQEKGAGFLSKLVVTYTTTVAQAVGGGAIAIAGTLVLLTKLTVGAGSIAISGALSSVLKFFQTVGSGSIAIAGALSFRFLQAVGAGNVAIASSLGRLIKLTVGAGSIAIAGALGLKTLISVGGGAVTSAGALALKIKIAVGAGAVTIVGALVFTIFRILGIKSTLSNDLTIKSTLSTDLMIKSTLSNDLTITSTLGGN